MTQQIPEARPRGSSVAKSPEQVAADAERSTFIAEMISKGGKLWVGGTEVKNSKKITPTRIYFERTEAEYAAEIKTLRAAAGGKLSQWPLQQLGYVDVNTREYVSARRGVSNADFKASLKPLESIPATSFSESAEPVEKSPSGIGAGVLVQRQANAAECFVDSAMSQFGLSQEESRAALDKLLELKVVSLDPHSGQFNLRDGRFWDGEVLRRAAADSTGSDSESREDGPVA